MGIAVLCLIAAVVFAFNVVNDTYLPFVLDICFILTVAVSLIVLLITAKKTKVTVLGDESVFFTGNDEKIQIKIRNDSIFPISLGYIKVLIKHLGCTAQIENRKIKFVCPGRKTISVYVDIKSNNCERLKVTVKSVKITDLFEIVRKKTRVFDAPVFYVIPQKKNENALIKKAFSGFKDESTIYDTQKAGDDFSEIFGIREYASGDKIRSIHWKLSAKESKLMVKEGSRPLTRKNLIVVDIRELSKTLQSRYNGLFNVLTGLTHALLNLGEEINICFNDNGLHVENVYNVETLISAFKALLRADNPGYVSAAAMYAENEKETAGRVFFISAYGDELAQEEYKRCKTIGETVYLDETEVKPDEK